MQEHPPAGFANMMILLHASSRDYHQHLTCDQVQMPPETSPDSVRFLLPHVPVINSDLTKWTSANQIANVHISKGVYAQWQRMIR